MAEPKRRVEQRDEYGPYIEEWHCDPPPPGAAYEVVACEWDPLTDPPTRRVYRIRRLYERNGEDENPGRG